MEITYYGHSCLGIQTAGQHLLIDPFVTGNPLAKSVDINGIPADFILITHAHGDHMHDAETIAKRTGARIIGNFEIVTYFEGKGCPGVGMNIGGQAVFPFGHLKSVTALHSSVFPDGTNGGNPGGFVLWNEEGCIYLAGDTALTLDMQLIPMTCPPVDVAVLPIGDHFTMGYTDACIAADFVGCDHVIGCHYDTFDAICIDRQAAMAHFARENKTLLLPAIGETLTL